MILKTLLGAAALLAAAIFLPVQTAEAQGFDRKAVTGDMVASWLQEKGYRAELTEDGVGDPLILTTMSGVTVRIFFYNCDTSKRCEDLQFLAGFDLTDGLSNASVSEWNQTKRFGAVYLDDENDPYLKIDLQVGPGGTPDLVKGYFSTVEAVLDQFKDHIDFN